MKFCEFKCAGCGWTMLVPDFPDAQSKDFAAEAVKVHGDFSPDCKHNAIGFLHGVERQ